MRLAFFQPDIPQNLGAALRLTACLGARMEVIEPCAFPLSDRGLRRAALDYGPSASLPPCLMDGFPETRRTRRGPAPAVHHARGPKFQRVRVPGRRYPVVRPGERGRARACARRGGRPPADPDRRPDPLAQPGHRRRDRPGGSLEANRRVSKTARIGLVGPSRRRVPPPWDDAEGYHLYSSW